MTSSPPWVDLPAEIVTEILLDSIALVMKEPLTSEYDMTAKPWAADCNSLDSRNSPWSLSQVCNWWRRVALSTPQLWSFIFVRIRTPLDVTPRRGYLLKLLLARSAGQRLFVVIDMKEALVAHAQVSCFLDGLHKETNRWHTVILRNAHIPPGDPLPVSRLVRDGSSSISRDSFPSLTDVAWYSGMNPSYPWHQITRFAWYPTQGPDISRLLSATNLLHLRIGGAGPDSPLTHPSIRKLEWLSNFSRMRNLTLPALEDLFLANRAGVWSLDDCIEMVKRSKCSIRRLAFQGKFQDTEMEELLELVSETLQQVELYGCYTPLLRGEKITLRGLQAHRAKYPRPKHTVDFQIID